MNFFFEPACASEAENSSPMLAEGDALLCIFEIFSRASGPTLILNMLEFPSRAKSTVSDSATEESCGAGRKSTVHVPNRNPQQLT